MAGDDIQEHGLTPLAYDAICRVRRAIASHLAERLPVDGDSLRFILEGSVGATIAVQVLAERVRAEFPQLFVDVA